MKHGRMDSNMLSTARLHRRTRRIHALMSLGILLVTTAAVPRAAMAVGKPKTTATSTKKYCAAAKAWLAYETKTLEVGPYDGAWVQETKRLLIPLGANTPKSQRGYMAVFILSLIGDRSLVAGTEAITSVDDIDWLRTAAADVQGSVSSIAARNAIGIYTQKTCKIDVLKPFRDLAKGFE